MSTLEPFASTPEAIAAALAEADYELPHASIKQLPKPHYLIHADSTLSGLTLTTGTVVVTGSLTVTGPVDVRQAGRPLAHIIVLGDCAFGLAYVDGFLIVRGNLQVGTLIADSNWNGGVFVGGDLAGHSLVIKDVSVEVDGGQHVEKVADFDDLDAARVTLPALFEHSEEPRGFYIALRDSSAPLVPAPPAPSPTKEVVAKAAKKPAKKAAKKPVKKAAKKPAKKAAKKPVKKKAKKPVKKPAKKKPAKKKPAKKPAKKKR
jgi:hypothetical protein